MDLLTDPYIAELRAMHDYVEAQLARLDSLYPLTATANPSLSPDAGAAVAVGGLTSEQRA